MTIEELKLHMMDDIKLKLQLKIGQDQGKQVSKYDGGVDSDQECQHNGQVFKEFT